MSSRQTQRMQQTSSNGNSSFLPDPSLPLVSKIQQFHIHNLEYIVSMLVDLTKKLLTMLQYQEIQINEKLLSPKNILAIKDATNQLKYHQKINPVPHQQSSHNISDELEQLIQLLTKMKSNSNEGILPKVKRIQDFHIHGLQSQLSTITQKESQQNLLHNYLRKGYKKRSKSTLNKNFYQNTSSIEELEFQVIREQTRKSLDNPYHKNNQHRKSLYNELQKMKGQDKLLPSVKNYLDKHRKHAEIKSKLSPYQIQKLL